MHVLYQFFATMLTALHGVTHSYGWSVIIFALGIKLLLYYPTQQQYKSMKDMQLIQPEMKRIQEKYKDDPERLQRENMELFKKHNVNPLGGCLPMLAQMPILYGIYGGIRDIFLTPGHPPIAKETFLWIGSSLADKYPHFFAQDFGHNDTLLVLFYGFSMWLSQRATMVPTADPAQAQQQKMMNTFMPLFFTWMMWKWALPCALVLYWCMFNLFNVIQQVHLMNQRNAAGPGSGTQPAPKSEDPEDDRGSKPSLVKPANA